MINTIITKQSTTLGTSNLPSGVYFYKVISNDKTIPSGKLIGTLSTPNLPAGFTCLAGSRHTGGMKQALSTLSTSSKV